LVHFDKKGSVNCKISISFVHRFSSNRHSASELSVNDTKAEIKTAAPMTTPNSRNKRPTNPSKKITGKNTAAR
jgi:hypothetical protein